MAEIIDRCKIHTKDVLLFAVDALAIGLQIFDRHGLYRKNIEDYFAWRDFDRSDFQTKLYKLQASKMIKVYRKGKDKYLELTAKGIKNAEELLIKNYEWGNKIWDKKWRIIIFDVPNNRNEKRDAFRRRLLNWGFIQFQKSVFVFPYECRSEVEFIARRLYIENNVRYIVADFFQDDHILIKKFIKSGILTV